MKDLKAKDHYNSQILDIMKGGKMSKQTIIIVILAVLLIVTAAYIGYEKYAAFKSEQQFQAGNFGYQKAILDIANIAVTCQQVPLIVGNNTIHMIAVECLQAANQGGVQ